MAASGSFASFDVPDGARKRDIEPRLSSPLISAGKLSKKKLGKVTKPKAKKRRR